MSVSIAKRLKTTARAPARSAASASAGRSLAVSTTTRTRRASASTSASALRSICKSSRSTSHGARSIAGRISATRSTSATTTTSGSRRSIDRKPWRKSAWSSASTSRSGAGIVTSPAARPRHGRRPRGARREADAVVVDRDVHGTPVRRRRDRRRRRARMAPHVAGPLEHDQQRVLDEQKRALEAGVQRKARGTAARGGASRGREVDQRADVGAQRVVLAIEPGLEVHELGQRLLGAAAVQEPATALEPQRHAGERLRVAVVQRARDPLPLRGGLEGADARLERETLLAQIADEVADDGEVGGPHGVEGQAFGPRGEDESEVEGDAHPRHAQGEPETRAKARGEHREREEDVEGAVGALGDERDRYTGEDVGPRADDG